MIRRCAGFLFSPILALMLGACASQFANSYIGKDSVVLELENGKPVNIVELPDGMRSFQYYWGGESVVIPGTGVAGLGSPGCLINFIAERRGDRWFVVKTQWIDRIVC